MVLFRCFMRLLKPSNELLKRKNKGSVAKFRLGLYRLLLKSLKKTYLHYAISDTVELDNDRIKIVHEFRDEAFEQELKRNGVDVRPHLLSCEVPMSLPKGKRTRRFRYFKFKDRMEIWVDNKNLCVNHGNQLQVEGSLSVKGKGSTGEDIIARTILAVKATRGGAGRRAVSADADEVLGKEIKPRKASPAPKAIFGKDSSPKSAFPEERKAEVPVVPEEKEPVVPEAQPIEKKGFEIDTSF